MGEIGRAPRQVPLRRDSLLGAGVRRGEIERDYVRVVRGVWVRAGQEVDLWTRIGAALALHGRDAVVSHATAAQLYGLPVRWDPEIHLTLRRDVPRSRVAGMRPHQPRIRPRWQLIDGVRVTTPEQTFLDLARPLTLVDLVVVGDALVARGLTTRERLVEAADVWRGHGARLARRAAGFVRRGVESPQESRTRMLVVLAGLPEPTINRSFYTWTGAFLARLDLAYEAYLLAIEYDGRQHALDTRQWKRDITRRGNLDSAGWRLVVVVDDDLFRTPGQTLVRILEAMHAQGMPVPRTPPSEEWRAHFPGR